MLENMKFDISHKNEDCISKSEISLVYLIPNGTAEMKWSNIGILRCGVCENSDLVKISINKIYLPL